MFHQLIKQDGLIETDEWIGKYELGRQIGSGQHAIVKKCYDHEKSQTYALKILKDDETIDHIYAELETLSLLTSDPPHPNILELYDCFRGNKGVYMVLEYSQSDLFDFLANYHHILDFNICGLIISEIATALQFMKTRNLVHGDLKPENVLIDITKERLVVKLCDFGTCQYSAPGQMLTSVYVGTSGFHSPEVWLTPECYCPYASDVFSLGCIALEIILREIDFLTKWMPNYNSRDNFDIFLSQFADSLPNIRSLIQEAFTLPSTMKSYFPSYHPSTEIFQGMIDVNPEKRPNLSQIRNCELCKSATHSLAIRTLLAGDTVWNRRKSERLDNSRINNPKINPQHSLQRTSSLPPIISSGKALTQSLLKVHSLEDSSSINRQTSLQEYDRDSTSTISPFQSLRTDSNVSDVLELSFVVKDDVPITESLFETPSSRSITRWAESQHLKCKQSIQLLKKFHNFTSNLSENQTEHLSSVFNIMPNISTSLTSQEGSLRPPLKKLPSLPTRCTTTSISKKLSLYRKSSNLT